MISNLEICANIIITVSIVLAGRNSVHTWWTGIIGCGLFALLFWQVNLYADVLLQLFFILTSALGWWQWQRGDKGQALAITSASGPLLFAAVLLGAMTALAYGALLHRFTDAYAPFIDSAVLVFSVIAQLLLMQRRRQTWVFWLLVNSLAVPLFISRGLYLTAFLYALYWINALVSFYRWRHLQRQTIASSVAFARA
jgi:nicotinamide mononucleotide transporter